jgi:hypothetical protein
MKQLSIDQQNTYRVAITTQGNLDIDFGRGDSKSKWEEG